MPFDSLNLALNERGDRGATARNLELLLGDFAPGCAVADLSQVHGNHVVRAHPGADREPGDAIVTDQADVVLLVRAADCVPVLLADPGAGVVGAVHAGRQGVVLAVVEQTMTALRELGARRLTAWMGPRVCGACYEVPLDLQAEVVDAVPSTRATTSWGTPGLDLGAGVRAQLESGGVTVVDVGACTRESPDLYSHRRDGDGSGRLAGVIRIDSRGPGRA